MDTSRSPLERLPVETWPNAILFRLAEALGYEAVDGVITANVDEVLDKAVDTIWRYKDLEF